MNALFKHPTAAELIKAVIEQLESELLPSLQGEQTFHLRISINALRMVGRELDEGAQLIKQDEIALQNLVGDANTKRNAEESAALLIEKIKLGELSENDADLMDYLFSHTQRRLKIDNPRYRYEKIRNN
jgi:hypothetical protein